jgi:assimilatory nitrate reductase electron transfer subunit
VLGLETARGLAAGGLPVALIQRGRRLMERQLDATAARVLARTVRALGVRIVTGASVKRVLGSERITGIRLDDGRTLSADLLVLCCGMRPRTELARSAGIAIEAGIVVDDHMRSITDSVIFAIGDCAQHRGRTHGLVAPAWAQARAAAQAVAAQATGARRGGSGVPDVRDRAPAQARLRSSG